MAGTFQPINLKEALEFLHSQHSLVLAGGFYAQARAFNPG